MTPLDSQHADEIAALLAIADEKSFVAAGLALQRHPTVVSKRLAALEKRLGVRLLERTTRQVRLTDIGASLADRFRAASELIMEAEQNASRGAAEIRGTLRLSFPATMGRLWLGPMLPEFLALHPLLVVDASYSNRYVDLIAEGFDAAVRIGSLADSRMVARKLSDHHRILGASPAYIAQYGLPETPADLANHNCLSFTGLKSFPEWKLFNGDRRETVLARGTLIADDSEALVAAARAGVGILGAGDWHMSRDIAAGRLVRVLPEWSLDAQVSLYLVRPSAKFTPAKTRAFVDWLTEKCAVAPPWSIA